MVSALNGHEFKQAPGDDDGQGSMACCSLRDCKESDVTGRLDNNNNTNIKLNNGAAGRGQLRGGDGGSSLYFLFSFSLKLKLL